MGRGGGEDGKEWEDEVREESGSCRWEVSGEMRKQGGREGQKEGGRN